MDKSFDSLRHITTVTPSRINAVGTCLLNLWHSATQRVMLVTFSGMLLGFAMDILIATKLGTGQTADALIIALSLPLLIDTVFREGTRFSMVPPFLEKQVMLSRSEYHSFISGFINFSLVLGVLITVLVEVLAPWVIKSLAIGFSSEGQNKTITLLRICSPLIIFTFAISALSVFLNSQKKFNLAALRNAIAPGAVILFIGVCWNSSDITLWIATAYVVGFVLFFIILFWGAKIAGYSHSWSAWISRKEYFKVWHSILLPTVGFFMTQSTRLVERALASIIAVGGVATYYFAFRIFSAIQTIIGVSIATTGLPAMAQHHLSGEKDKLANLIRKNISRTIIITLPIIISIFFFHKDIIRIFYGHGLFGERSVYQSSKVLLWLGGGLIFNCVVPVLESGLYAQKAYGFVLRNMALFTCVNIALALMLSQIWGLIGIAIALSLSKAIAVSQAVYLLRKMDSRFLKKSDYTGRRDP